jgi:hypothetical protein
MGPIGCSETSVGNYHYSLRNSPKERFFNVKFGCIKERRCGKRHACMELRIYKTDRARTSTRYIEAQPLLQWKSNKAISITYSECVFLVLGNHNVSA